MIPILLATALAAAAENPLPPASLEARVAESIADSWNVPATAVRLSWGAMPELRDLRDDAPFRIAGRGVDGWFAVLLNPTEPRSLAIRVRAGIDDTVMVAARPLGAGAQVAEGDLRSDVRLHWGSPASDRAERAEAGWEVRRALAAGEVAAWPAVVPPALVAAGQPVRLIWDRGAVSVSIAGVALNSARKGEAVRVRVAGRSDRLVGTAIAPGAALLDRGGIR